MLTKSLKIKQNLNEENYATLFWLFRLQVSLCDSRGPSIFITHFLLRGCEEMRREIF
jgi:hypothetical protein